MRCRGAPSVMQRHPEAGSSWPSWPEASHHSTLNPQPSPQRQSAHAGTRRSAVPGRRNEMTGRAERSGVAGFYDGLEAHDTRRYPPTITLPRYI